MPDNEIEAAKAARRPEDMSDQPGWDALIEDIFGLSVRGLSTVKDMFVRPAVVLDAGRSRHWLDRYTPSLRLVMSLIALMLVLRVFWAAENSTMFQSILSQLETLGAQRDFEIEDPISVAKVYFTAFALVFPFAYIFVHFLMALVTRIWGKGTKMVVRLRLYFAAVIPSVVLSVISMSMTPLLSVDFFLVATVTGSVLALIVSVVTIIRGLATQMALGARIWRGVLFGVLVSVADIICSVTASLLGGIAAGYVLAGGSLPFLQ